MVQTINSLEDTFALTDYAKPATEIVRRAMDQDPSHDEGHLVRVIRNMFLIAPDDVDWDIAIPAAILHDLVNAPKNDLYARQMASRLSATTGTDALREILLRELPSETASQKLTIYDNLGRIAHAIEAHSFSANIEPMTLEAKLVQDADRLEALGMIGVTRCIAVSGRIAKTLFHSSDPAGENRPLDDWTYGLDHFPVKLYGLVATMKTHKGRIEAERRVKRMEAFRKQLCSEVLGTFDEDFPGA